MAGERAGERSLADRGDPQPRRGGRLGEDEHALLGAEPADEEEAVARAARGRARIGQAVGPDADPLGRDPRGRETLAGEGRQGDEPVDVAPPGPGPAVVVDHARHRQRADPRAAVAGMEDRPVRRAGHAPLARRAVPHQEAVGAGQAVIVQGLYRGVARRPGGGVDAGREEREEIVDVDHVRAKAPCRRHDPADSVRRVGRGESRPQPRGRGIDRVVVEEHRLDGAAGALQGREVAGHCGILPAADLVAVVGDEDAQRGTSVGRRRRGSARTVRADDRR